MDINEKNKSEITYNLLKKGLNTSFLRSKISANNIANVNTKGYKAYYVTFEDSLKKNIENLNLKTTDAKHIKQQNTAFGEINVEREEGCSMRQDGNSVDIDSEMANLAANKLMYDSLVAQVNNRLSTRRYVISGGR